MRVLSLPTKATHDVAKETATQLGWIQFDHLLNVDQLGEVYRERIWPTAGWGVVVYGGNRTSEEEDTLFRVLPTILKDGGHALFVDVDSERRRSGDKLFNRAQALKSKFPQSVHIVHCNSELVPAIVGGHIGAPSGVEPGELEGRAFCIDILQPDEDGLVDRLSSVLEGLKLDIINMTAAARDRSMAKVTATVGASEMIRQGVIEDALGTFFPRFTVTRLLANVEDLYGASSSEDVIRFEAHCYGGAPGRLASVIGKCNKSSASVRHLEVRGTSTTRGTLLNKISVVIGVGPLTTRERTALVDGLRSLRGFLRAPRVTDFQQRSEGDEGREAV